MNEKRLAICDIYNDKDHIAIKLEMPGVPKENLDIKIEADSLIIDAKKNLSEVDGDYRLREIDSRDYHHEFTIDDTIDREKVNATANNGVVEITLGVKESVKPRKIEVVDI